MVDGGNGAGRRRNTDTDEGKRFGQQNRYDFSFSDLENTNNLSRAFIRQLPTHPDKRRELPQTHDVVLMASGQPH
ncbi:hypothetical protein Csa_022739 [Cucumis sativus]|uniref:Uncharacterized protein n=1 Tax=Cucumis sativus TaxID=3659 RepID=A0A0A0LT10_CUCSA|nr:hypothetical protein Csa_022739 [Cucumis sativus]